MPRVNNGIFIIIVIVIIIIIIIIQLTQVFAGEDPSSKLAVMFDVFGSLLVITNNKYVFTAHSA